MAEEHDTVRGLVLAGGGAKGSYQVGVYQALMELGWQRAKRRRNCVISCWKLCAAAG